MDESTAIPGFLQSVVSESPERPHLRTVIGAVNCCSDIASFSHILRVVSGIETAVSRIGSGMTQIEGAAVGTTGDSTVGIAVSVSSEEVLITRTGLSTMVVIMIVSYTKELLSAGAGLVAFGIVIDILAFKDALAAFSDLLAVLIEVLDVAPDVRSAVWVLAHIRTFSLIFLPPETKDTTLLLSCGRLAGDPAGLCFMHLPEQPYQSSS